MAKGNRPAVGGSGAMIETSGGATYGTRGMRQVFWYYVNQKNKEVAIGKNPSLQHLYYDRSKVGETGGEESRAFDVLHPTMLKMYSTSNDKMKAPYMLHLYIEVYPTAPKIKLTGLGGFGGFKGRGEVNLKLSKLVERNCEPERITAEWMKENLDYAILKKSKREANNGNKAVTSTVTVTGRKKFKKRGVLY